MDSFDPSNNCANVHEHGETHTSSQSPVHHLLESNQPPTATEVALTHDAMKTIEIGIAEMDEEIAKARAVVEDMLGKRKAMQANSNAHAGIISTLRRVPPEILAHIFVFCLPAGPVDPRVSGMAPILLENVCRRWRDISRTTPELWTAFRLSMNSGTMEMDALAAKTWLSRSGDLPLMITLGTPLSGECIPSPEVHAVLDDIFTHCSRWKEVTSFLPHSLVKRFIVVKGRLPTLESIKIFVPWSSPESQSWPSSVDAFKDAPRLTSLELDGDIVGKNALDIAWHGLTKLVLECGTSSAFMALLRDCTSLEVLTIVNIEDDLQPRDSRFELSNLHTFDVGTDIASHCFFAELVLPALRHVTISLSPHRAGLWDDDEADDPTSWNSRRHFLALLSRSKCSIHSINLQSEVEDCFSEADLLACLRAMPSLSELEIREYATFALTRSILRRMTYRPDKGSSQLVPNLQALKIDWRKPAFHDEAFANMVGSRWIFNGPPERKTLQIVELEIIPPDEEEDDDDCFEDSLLDGEAFDPTMIRETLRILRRCKMDGMKAKVVEEEDDLYPMDWLTV